MRFAGLVNLTLNEGEQDKEKWNGRSWNKFRMTELKYVILAEAGICFQNYSWIYHPFGQIYDSSRLCDSLHSLWSSFSSPVKCIVTLSRTPIYTGMTSQEYKPPICSPSLRASLSSPASSHSWDESGKRGTSMGSCISKIPHSNQLEYGTLCHRTDNNTRVKASILMKRTKYETLEESFLYASLPINSQRSFSSICNTGDSCMFRGFLKHYFICSPRRSAFSGSYCYIYKCRWKRMKH